jgi:hypothetical protein
MMRLFRRGGKSVTVGSGLPRSGTSLMLQMLEAGGMAVLTDGEREADANNPRGYYEYEPVKQLEHGVTGWLHDAEGKAVKVISALLPYLPPRHSYRVLFMQRDLDEVLRSQAAMLTKLKGSADGFDAAALRRDYAEHLRGIHNWLAQQPHLHVLQVDYNALVASPAGWCSRVAAFLERDLDTARMAAAVDPSLYRQRKQPEEA